jgi:cobalamin biosynthesis Co2+ chelatase CbiK
MLVAGHHALFSLCSMNKRLELPAALYFTPVTHEHQTICKACHLTTEVSEAAHSCIQNIFVSSKHEIAVQAFPIFFQLLDLLRTSDGSTAVQDACYLSA